MHQHANQLVRLIEDLRLVEPDRASAKTVKDTVCVNCNQTYDILIWLAIDHVMDKVYVSCKFQKYGTLMARHCSCNGQKTLWH